MPDLSAWNLVESFTVDQAACLWFGYNPAPYFTDPLRPNEERARIDPVKQMLTAAIRSGDLEADTSRNPFADCGDHSLSWVPREALHAYAENKKQRPAFLFDTLLPGDDTPTKVKNKGGRPREYDWDAFTIELIRVANTPDGLPEKQSKLVVKMQEWCFDK